MKRQLGVTLFFALGALTPACLNDRDTLAVELRSKPDFQLAVTGRFDRFPNLYYELRIKRLTAQKSLTFDEFDDLAVAYGRIGKDKEGLAVLEQKRLRKPTDIHDRYTLYANRGTLRAHLWLKQGAKTENLTLLKQAESDIVNAIKLNPDAHFGREGAQLEAIRWLVALRKSPKTTPHLGKWILTNYKDGDPIEGLVGLVTLGAAWESPDVALALATISASNRSYEVASTLAFLRAKELLTSGKKSFMREFASSQLAKISDLDPEGSRDPRYRPSTRFRALRAEADQWHANKTQFMLDRLSQGRHPDTDPKFWDGWIEPALPKLPLSRNTPWHASSGWKHFAPTAAFLALAFVAAIALLVYRDRHRHTQGLKEFERILKERAEQSGTGGPKSGPS